jgi:hypothetical protein
MDLPVNVIANDRSSVTIDLDGAKYCLTCNVDSYPDDVEYILLANVKPTIERIIAMVMKMQKNCCMCQYREQERIYI